MGFDFLECIFMESLMGWINWKNSVSNPLEKLWCPVLVMWRHVFVLKPEYGGMNGTMAGNMDVSVYQSMMEATKKAWME